MKDTEIIVYPALTAKTPALGLGLSTKCATSPHANTPGVLQLSRLACQTHSTKNKSYREESLLCEVEIICLMDFMVVNLKIILVKWLILIEIFLGGTFSQSSIRSEMFQSD